MKKTITFTILLLAVFQLFAQKIELVGTEYQFENTKALQEKFAEYKIFKMDASNLYKELKNNPYTDELELQLDGFDDISLQIYPTHVASADFKYTEFSDEGKKTNIETPAILTYQGNMKESQDQKISFAILDHMFQGRFIQNGKTYYIEPIQNHTKAKSTDLFVIYDEEYVISREVKCGVNHSDQFQHNQEENLSSNRTVGSCQTVRIAMHNDFEMWQTNGWNGWAILFHNHWVINDVNTDFDYNINRDYVLQFEIQEITVFRSAAQDPWLSLIEAEDVLWAFRNWAPTGFSTVHDLGQLWTGRNFGTTLGIAFMPGICSSVRYSLCVDFSEAASELRTLASHEIGHNLGADHAPFGIMSTPFISATTAWHSISVAEIDNRLQAVNCLQDITAPTCNVPATPPYDLNWICSLEEPVCYTFNYPCMTGIELYSPDRKLLHQVNGTTICLSSIYSRRRTSQLFVTPTGVCGPSGNTQVWNILIDNPFTCDPFGPDGNLNNPDFATQRFSYNFKNGLTINDSNFNNEVKEIQVVDMNGRVLHKGTYNEDQISLNFLNLPNTILFVQIQSEQGTEILKIPNLR